MSNVRREPLRLLALLLASTIAIGLVGAAVATAAADVGVKASRSHQRSGKAALDDLLNRFPIGTQPIQTTPQPPSITKATKPAAIPNAREPEPAARGSEEAAGDHTTFWAALGAGTSVLVIVVVLGARAVRRRARVRGASSTSGLPLSIHLETVALANQECDRLDSGHLTPRSLAMTEVSQDQNPPQPEPPQAPIEQLLPSQPDSQTHVSHPVREQDFADLGEHVAGILKAAEAAAAKIRADATEAAAEIRNTAAAEASAHLEKTRTQAAAIRNEAETSARDTRSAAESYGTQQRREVDEHARKELAEAEVQARATRQTAEEMARQIEVAAHERESALRTQIRPMELKVQRALESFRDMSRQLEELLETTPEAGGESLVDALSVPVRRAESLEETPSP
jgi:hypothetical protein